MHRMSQKEELTELVGLPCKLIFSFNVTCGPQTSQAVDDEESVRQMRLLKVRRVG